MTESPLAAASRAFGDRPAIITSDETITYANLSARVAATRDHLTGLGVSPGDRVGLLMHDSTDFVVLLYAIIHLGGAAAPISTRVPMDSVNDRLARIGTRVLFHDDEAATSSTDSLRLLSGRAAVAGGGDRPGALYDLDRSAVATIVHTSGSTGRPRPAAHSLNNHLYSARGSNDNIPLGSGDRWLLSLPLYHVGGLAILFRCLISGAAVVVPDSRDDLGAVIEQFDVTHASLVATQLQRLLSARTSVGNTLRAILLGGSRIPNALIRKAVQRNLPVHVSYGSTEMSSQITTTPSGASLTDLLTSSGKTLPHRELSIASDGEILVRGKTLFRGFLDEDEENTTAHRDGGWYATGDTGHLDARGYLHVEGRKDNMFISGGENIQPEEVSGRLEELEDIHEAVVVPVTDETWGFRPVAYVRWVDEPRPLELVREALAPSLERYKHPVAILDWPGALDADDLKIDRGELQKLAEKRINR